MKSATVRLSASMLLLAAVSAQAMAGEPLRVDITQGVTSPLMIAVPDVASPAVAGVGAAGEAAGTALARVVRADLSGTGIYRLVPSATPLAPGVPAMTPWQKAGVQALVVGRASVSASGQLAYECSLYEVFAAKAEFSRIITVPAAQWRRAAHKCADMVFEQTTGDPGHFDTRIAYVAESGPKVGRTKRLAVMDYDGANQAFLTRGLDLIAMPRFAPDGRAIVYMTYLRRQPRIMVYDLATATTRPVELPPGTVFAPRFSPDGRTLAFSLGQGGDTDIYSYDMAAGTVRRLTATPGVDTSPSFSSDGSRIAFESSRSGQQQVYVMAADGSGQTRISFGGGRYGSPVWSPRGDLIAYTRIGGDGFRIGVMRPDGSWERLLTDDWQDESPSWAPSGRAIAFLRTRRGEALPELWTTDLTGRVQRRIGIPDGGSDPGWSGGRP